MCPPIGKTYKVLRRLLTLNEIHDGVNSLIFQHNLLREIYEQPKAIRDTLKYSYHHIENLICNKFRGQSIFFLGMGSSYFSSIYAKYLFSNIPKIQVDALSAAEVLYYPPKIPENSVICAISQSGESVETIKAIEKLKENRLEIWAITNTINSTLSRLADETLLTYAGDEKSSATKTFLSINSLLYLLWAIIGVKEECFKRNYINKVQSKVEKIAEIIQDKLNSLSETCKSLSHEVAFSRSLIVLGRGYTFCAALQGALLFKEVAKIHAEAMKGGDFRHGPIELINPNLLVISLGAGKTWTLMDKVSRDVTVFGGRSILVSDRKAPSKYFHSIILDKVDERLSPLLFTVPLELLAYHSAILKGRNPDLPEYLSKITKVE